MGEPNAKDLNSPLSNRQDQLVQSRKVPTAFRFTKSKAVFGLLLFCVLTFFQLVLASGYDNFYLIYFDLTSFVFLTTSFFLLGHRSIIRLVKTRKNDQKSIVKERAWAHLDHILDFSACAILLIGFAGSLSLVANNQLILGENLSAALVCIELLILVKVILIFPAFGRTACTQELKEQAEAEYLAEKELIQSTYSTKQKEEETTKFKFEPSHIPDKDREKQFNLNFSWRILLSGSILFIGLIVGIYVEMSSSMLNTLFFSLPKTAPISLLVWGALFISPIIFMKNPRDLIALYLGRSRNLEEAIRYWEALSYTLWSISCVGLFTMVLGLCDTVTNLDKPELIGPGIATSFNSLIHTTLIFTFIYLIRTKFSQEIEFDREANTKN